VACAFALSLIVFLFEDIEIQGKYQSPRDYNVKSVLTRQQRKAILGLTCYKMMTCCQNRCAIGLFFGGDKAIHQIDIFTRYAAAF
jgi:hypothetical protein